jgi:hypothetical protein
MLVDSIELRLKGLLAALTKRKNPAILLYVNRGLGHGENAN